MHQLTKALGLNAKESQTFLKLLALGAQPVSIVAKHVGVPRSSMYFILDRLRALQLVEEFERSGIKYVKCIPVTSIRDVLKSREKKALQIVELFDEHEAELRTMENTMSITPKVTFSEGKESVMRMYESVLREKEVHSFFNPAALREAMPEYLHVIPEALRDSGAEAWELLVDSPEARAYKEKFTAKRHRIRILPSDTVFQSDCIICKDRLCMITYGENQISAIELFAPTLAATQLAIFERLWSMTQE